MGKITKQTIKDGKGKIVAIVLPIEEYDMLIEAYEELQDIKAADAAEQNTSNTTNQTLESYIQKRKLEIPILQHANL